MDESILTPVKSYFDEYQAKNKQLTEQYFDDLVGQSGVSPEENAALMEERAKALDKLKAADAYLKKYKGLKIFLIALSVILPFAGVIVCLGMWNDSLRWVGILVAVLCVAVAAALIAIVCALLNKRVKEGGKAVADHKQTVADIESRAWRQMQPLNSKYDWNIVNDLIYRTVPHIQLDKYFDEEKLAYFDKHCTLAVYGEDSSAVCVKSGNSDGRPFLYTRFLRQSMVPHTYTGTRLVTWTEWETDSQGNRRSVTKSETLVATVVKPKPDYRYVTYLFFGSDAAADLHFSRKPVVPADADDKDVDKLVKRGEKALEKKARQAVKDGGSYNKLANSEFEVLFGADDRDNEMQFRMMFTPLAQQNMVELLTSKKPYGDDFYFDKLGAVNVIRSRHSAQLEIDANPTRFIDFDLARARQNFVDFNCNYFRSLYFDFAPLFSVPLYTQDLPAHKFGECTKIGDIGPWEAEAVANYFDGNRLAHPSTATQLILKAQTESDEHGVVAHITAHSFETVPQVDFVPVHCRDGNTYEVPVNWTLYLPLEQITDISLQSLDVTREEFNRTNADNALFIGGIKANIL